jgi:large subunit ribosomal protein L31
VRNTSRPPAFHHTNRTDFSEEATGMKPDIHPAYNETTVTCGCGNTFTTRSTSPTGQLTVEVCSACHPFYTGKQKILDTGGRVARFEKRFGKNPSVKPADSKPADKK